MKRSIPRSLVKRALEKPEGQDPDEIPQSLETKLDAPPVRGAGSAWKSGALAQSQAAVEEARQTLVEEIMAGRHELSLSPDQVTDVIGSDRREDWKDQAAFKELVQSIEVNGQDTPITVLPVDPDWRPDTLNPTDVRGVPFLLLTGRRRHAAVDQLGRSLRAVMGPASLLQADRNMFDLLFLRFRENEAREDLGAFERLLSIGEMYQHLKKEAGKLTAVAFAERIGVHESIVSRARTVFARRDEILNAFKNAYDMSFAELQRAVAKLDPPAKSQPKKKVQKLSAQRKIGGRKLSLTHQDGNLSIKAMGIPVDQSQLEELSDLIAEYLNKSRKERSGNAPPRSFALAEQE